MELEHTRISEQDLETAWSKEIERRVAEIDAGTVELIRWEQVRNELFEFPRKSDVQSRMD